MILLLCYLCPPLAVMLMGRPGTAILNFMLTMFLFWIPGVKHALVVYADWKLQQQHNRLVEAVHYPQWFRILANSAEQNTAPQAPRERPDIGANGTVFRSKSR